MNNTCNPLGGKIATLKGNKILLHNYEKIIPKAGKICNNGTISALLFLLLIHFLHILTFFLRIL